MNGWIKIHRTMLQWEHFNEPSVVTVFLALLLSADRDGKTDINLGGLMELTELSHNTISRAIAKLVKSGEITRHKYGSRITTTIINWSEYQGELLTQKKGDNQKPSTQKIGQYSPKNRANIDPKNGSIQYNKNNKKDKNTTTTTTCACAHEKLVNELLSDGRIELAMMQHHITEQQYRQFVDEILADWQFRDLPDSDYNLTHFSSVLRYKVANINRNNGNNTQSSSADRIRAKLDADAVKAMAALAAEIGKPKVVPF